MLKNMNFVMAPLRTELLAIAVPLLLENKAPSGSLTEREAKLVSLAFRIAANILDDPSFQMGYRTGFFKLLFKEQDESYGLVNPDEIVAAVMEKVLGERLLIFTGIKEMFELRKSEMDFIRALVDKYNELEPGEYDDLEKYPLWPSEIIYNNMDRDYYQYHIPVHFHLTPPKDSTQAKPE
jgi:hypothetical protein